MGRKGSANDFDDRAFGFHIRRGDQALRLAGRAFFRCFGTGKVSKVAFDDGRCRISGLVGHRCNFRVGGVDQRTDSFLAIVHRFNDFWQWELQDRSVLHFSDLKQPPVPTRDQRFTLLHVLGVQSRF